MATKIQTSVTFDYTDGFPGLRYGSFVHDTITGIANGDIEFGQAVVEDDATPQVNGRVNLRLPSSVNDSFVGITLSRHIEPNQDTKRTPIGQEFSNKETTYEDGDAVPVLELGKVYVNVEEAVDRSNDVFVRVLTTSSNDTVGYFRSDKDQITINNVEIDSNVGTLTTATDHDLSVGDTVTIEGLTTTDLNGTFEVQSVPSSTTFTVDVTAGDVASTGDSGTIDRAFQLSNARFVTSTSGAGLAVIELN
jgi:hypothetical protein